jgi:hypothetical protein
MNKTPEALTITVGKNTYILEYTYTYMYIYMYTHVYVCVNICLFDIYAYIGIYR